VAAVLAAAHAPPAHAQAAPAARLDSLLLAVPNADSARAHSRALSARPHVAGTAAQRATADYVLRRMAAWGLDTLRVPYRVWLPHQDSAVVELVGPVRTRFRLEEPPLRSDPSTHGTPWPAMSGYSGAGDVTAPVIFANYGLAEDYAVLDSLGIDVRGRVVVVRYGRSFRGIKAREAERHGAAALLLYSDPWEDGYFRGVPYPNGPTRPLDAPERGSIRNGQGDPSTPGWGSTPDATRLPEDSLDVPGLPVLPLSARNAQRVLEALDGPEVPQAWQGALPFRYRIGGGGGAVRVRVAVWPERGTRAWKSVANTFGVLRGARWPEEYVIVGGHRDSWGPGAADNVSGVSVILEAARAWAAAATAGHRPARTLVFATWDAEEWGLIGSTEFVEAGRDSLAGRVVAYLNLDMPAFGRRFGGSGSPSLGPLLHAVTKAVRQPGDTASVYAAWAAAEAASHRVAAPPSVDDLGGGSDHLPFTSHLGVPGLSFGFGGPVGIYHSAYDTFGWMSRFGDPGFLSHRAAAQLATLVLARLGDEALLPLDLGAFGTRYAEAARTLAKRAAERGAPLAGGDRLAAAFDSLGTAGRRFSALRDSATAARGAMPAGVAARVNRLLRAAEREFVRGEGLPGRPWVRQLLVTSDRDRGYANILLPGVAEAIDDGEPARAEAEAADLAARASRAAALVDAAAAALAG
jgi:N-acetylated-alpha-linked acidic dipeptidase